MDRMMGSVGLSGRSFIPLLSSFACAIPGIMSTRTIANERDRLITILIIPLMTCSARLPVYALLIGAFIPQRTIGGFELQGIVLFALYLAGILGAMLVALSLKLLTPAGRQTRPLMMELPTYHRPTLLSISLFWQRVKYSSTVWGYHSPTDVALVVSCELSSGTRWSYQSSDRIQLCWMVRPRVTTYF